MDESISRQTQIGLYLVEDAILELLYITRLDDTDVWLNEADIHHALGLPTRPHWHYECVQIMLNALHEARKIERDGDKRNPFWRIADAEYRKQQNIGRKL